MICGLLDDLARIVESTMSFTRVRKSWPYNISSPAGATNPSVTRCPESERSLSYQTSGLGNLNIKMGIACIFVVRTTCAAASILV